jgi:hypothetical protein
MQGVIIPTLSLDFAVFYNFLLQIVNLLNNSLFIGKAKTQKLIAVPKIILSQDLKTTNLTCSRNTQYQFS